MPPRKSTSSMPPTDGEEGGAGVQSTEQQLKAQADGVNVDDLLLPRSVTQRLAKSVLPPNTTIQKDALLAIQKAATVFVSYLSSHANDATLKRTIAPSDVLSVLSELEFDSLHPRLERELEAHTEAQAGKKRATKEKKATASEGNPEDASMVSTGVGAKDGEQDDAGIREKKRVKRDSDGLEKTVPTTDDTEVEEEPGDDETEDAEDEEEDDEDEEDGEEEEDSDGGDETQEADDIDRVEDPDQRDRQVEADSDSEEDDDGPAAQLRSNMGLG
ncbi:hypothetical protein PISL3812_02215 [Talaromyces islandicus]|uniref:DNA polymerase epsilon subunit D n=1 Tax=Talaromyces islandicus TaxID=28573 RepID=A0A0U1LPA0_TALIS|nr:hypothetical protein PISL3812_02215 [Talaromyces islandicus]